jgi:hypothetical protein
MILTLISEEVCSIFATQSTSEISAIALGVLASNNSSTLDKP